MKASQAHISELASIAANTAVITRDLEELEGQKEQKDDGTESSRAASTGGSKLLIGGKGSDHKKGKGKKSSLPQTMEARALRAALRAAKAAGGTFEDEKKAAVTSISTTAAFAASKVLQVKM